MPKVFHRLTWDQRLRAFCQRMFGTWAVAKACAKKQFIEVLIFKGCLEQDSELRSSETKETDHSWHKSKIQSVKGSFPQGIVQSRKSSVKDSFSQGI